MPSCHSLCWVATAYAGFAQLMSRGVRVQAYLESAACSPTSITGGALASGALLTAPKAFLTCQSLSVSGSLLVG